MKHTLVSIGGVRVTRALIQLAILIGSIALPRLSHAESFNFNPPGGILLAQDLGEDAFDPFADYSEYEQTMEEEEDINFFRNGRLVTMGFIGGFRGWTNSLQRVYSGSPTFGLFLCYFFDLRFALQFGFLTSDHTFFAKPSNKAAEAVQGNVNITDLAFNLKFYFNTQNVTRGLADLNPYIIGGFSQVYRTTTVSGDDAYGKDQSFGVNLGAGIELPIMRNKMFWAVQGSYQLVNFPDEGKNIIDKNGVDTGVNLRGDSWLLLGILGINF